VSDGYVVSDGSDVSLIIIIPQDERVSAAVSTSAMSVKNLLFFKRISPFGIWLFVDRQRRSLGRYYKAVHVVAGDGVFTLGRDVKKSVFFV